MTGDARDGLSAIRALEGMLGSSSSLDVIHPGGHIWKAYFAFEPPAVQADITEVERIIPIALPWTYAQFLLYHNGMLLYHDREYGQWGIRLYSTQELVQENLKRRNNAVDDWPSNYILIAETLGDLDVLVLDTGRSTKEGKDCPVVDGDSGYLPSEWDDAAQGFSIWLDRLIVAQGAKYWRWR